MSKLKNWNQYVGEMPPPVFTAASPATATIAKTTQGVTRDRAAQMTTADTALSEISQEWNVILHSLIHVRNQKHPWE